MWYYLNIFHINEESDRFIKSCFIAKMNKTKLKIFNDKYFDFMYEDDFIKIIKYYIDNVYMQSDLCKTFNLCYKEKYKLSEIAKMILPESEIEILDDNCNRNYSGSNDKLMKMNIQLDGLENSLQLCAFAYLYSCKR